MNRWRDPGAGIVLLGPMRRTTTAAGDGSYSFSGVTPGDYTIQAAAPNLALPQPLKASLKGGVQTLELKLAVALGKREVSVEDTGAGTVSTDAPTALSTRSRACTGKEHNNPIGSP
jgi:hypothetical protein